MKRSIARRWAAALDSGEYKQGNGQLRDSEDNFCCLGVLCNIHAQEHPEIAAQCKHTTGYMGETEVLPKGVMYWAGLRTETGEFGNQELTDMNDNLGYDFQQLAKVIRKHWKEL